MTDVIVK